MDYTRKEWLALKQYGSFDIDNMIFEKAYLEDISSLVELRMAYLLDDYKEISQEKLTVIANNLSDYFRKHLNNDLFVYVCRVDHRIVSCCFLCITEKPSNPSFINGKTGTVLNVYTKLEYRRKGIAGNLLKMLLDESEKMNLDFVELQATDSGYNLYKYIGFKDVNSKYHHMKYFLSRS